MEALLGTSLGRYMNESMDLILYDLYGTALSAFCQKSNLRVAGVSADLSLFENSEAMKDFGLSIKEFYGGIAQDIFYSSREIAELDSKAYDLIIAEAKTSSEETALLEKLDKHFSHETPLTCPILLMRKFRVGVKIALDKISILQTCLNFRKLGLIAHALLATYDGCILECGSFRGGGTVFMGKLLDEWGDDRKIYTFDTFAGMPHPTNADGTTIYQSGVFADTSLEGVSSYVQEQGLAQKTTLIKGLVQDTLPDVLLREEHVSFALLDTDQYEGTLASLRLIVPKLQENGIILVDDYTVEGVKKAVSKIREQYPQVGGAEVSMNFYMLWNRTNRYFLSSCQVC
ncbi:MAG: hypothetical protein NPIRA02_02970 [Nitrospirales bacterium]|nr:MAG: hypothetical protein NPIRA02_02970 [Nitrospirales bacterium]